MLDALPAAARLVPELDRAAARRLSGGDTGQTWWVPLRSGGVALVKQPPPGASARLEAAGLRWLAAGGLLTPDILATDDDVLILAWVETTRPSKAAAHAFGTALARAHAAGAASFGMCPPGVTAATQFVGAVAVPVGSWPSWAAHYVHDRLRPAAEAARLGGGLGAGGLAAIERLCQALLVDPSLAGPPVPPARIHGDLWAGNLLWQDGQALAIDPAACGGHPETDLAMLHLFGAPYLDEIVAGYQDTQQLAAGWRQRVTLHQVFPLLVHAAMFGGGYGSSAARAATAALRTR